MWSDSPPPRWYEPVCSFTSYEDAELEDDEPEPAEPEPLVIVADVVTWRAIP